MSTTKVYYFILFGVSDFLFEIADFLEAETKLQSFLLMISYRFVYLFFRGKAV